MNSREQLTVEKYLSIMSLLSAFLLASATTIICAPNAQTSTKESSQSSAKDKDKKTAETQSSEKDANYFQLIGTALHRDGSAWEGVEVVLFNLDKDKNSSVFYYPDEKGVIQLSNPRAKADAKGRFAIKVHRGYLEKDAEETEFRIGYLSAGRGTEMRQKGGKEPLTLKIKKDVEVLDLGEIW
jgi:hypothetical protein